jgi:1-deoxy-D-xylulose-5-phosphate reductoisomerase
VFVGDGVVAMKLVALLGSTGSIGTSTLEVIANHSKEFALDLLVAGSNTKLLAEQIRRFRPHVAGLAEPGAFAALCDELGVSVSERRWQGTALISGSDEIVSAIKESRASLAVAAVVGMAGLRGVLAALGSGKDVALANKESLVAAGALVVEKARQMNVRLIPVDSEHSAIFQVLAGVAQSDLKSIILTASGGPFLNTDLQEFAQITPAQAVRHPKWNMGAKISVDSATLMNKALEVIEAKWLFDLHPDAIEVVVHPQSIIHSMIRLKDETVLAQMSEPDMKGPIGYALNFPNGRLSGVMPRLDFNLLKELTFRPLDHERFPSVKRALECLRGAKGAAAVFNAANEVAVAEFLNGSISFPSIFKVVDGALERFGGAGYSTLEELEELCRLVSDWARQHARSVSN